MQGMNASPGGRLLAQLLPQHKPGSLSERIERANVVPCGRSVRPVRLPSLVNLFHS